MRKRKESELLTPGVWTQAEVKPTREQRIQPDFETRFDQKPSNTTQPINLIPFEGVE